MEILILIGLVVVGAIVVGIIGAGKQEERRKEYDAAIAQERSALLTGPSSASLPVIEPSAVGYRPVGGEKLIAIHDGISRMEFKSTGRYRSHGSSVSIPIVKGVRYRVGNTSVRAVKEWQATAIGRLLITDKAVAFESPERNDRMNWSQIASVELHVDGFTIAKRSGPPRRFVARNPDPQFAAILDIVASRIA